MKKGGKINKTIITISRKTGSGGHSIAEKLANKLNYKLYDKDIIREVSRELNISSNMLVNHGEEKIERELFTKDRGRTSYYRYYTGRKWV